MTEEQFWEKIDAANPGVPTQAFLDRLYELLLNLSLDEIRGFYVTLNQLVTKACSFPLLAANFVLESYVSDDGFKNFRAWLVMQGQRKYKQALGNPESIVDWLKSEMVEDIQSGADAFNVPVDAYIEKGGDEDVFFRSLSLPRDPKIEIRWPENKGEYKRLYPRLVETFWNQERIRRMHGTE